MIPGHPGPNGRLGTRKDMEEQIAFMTDLAAEVKKASDAGKCFDPATKEVRVPKYATLAQIRAEHRVERSPLVRLLRSRHLNECQENPRPGPRPGLFIWDASA